MILFTRDILNFINDFHRCPNCYGAGNFNMKRQHHNKWVMYIYHCNLCKSDIDFLIKHDGSWCVWLNDVPQAIYRKDLGYFRLKEASEHWKKTSDEFVNWISTRKYAYIKRWLITTPSGEKHDIYNLNKFCREYDVPRNRVYQQCKGWRCKRIMEEVE